MAHPSESILARRPWLADEGACRGGFSVAERDWAPVRGPDDASSTAQLSLPRPDLGARLAAAYQRAVADFPEDRPRDMWAEITGLFQQELISLALAGDGEGLVNYLEALPRLPGGHGFLQGEAAFRALKDSEGQQGQRALWLMDHLVGMAEAVGALDARCPEQGDFERSPQVATVEALAEAIEASTGLPVHLPPVFDGLFGLDSAGRIVHLRSLMATYAIWQLGRLAGLQQGLNVLRVAEIGAGFGYTAWAAHYAGFSSYTIYDLPEVNLAQGYFLLRCLPPGQVQLYGEGVPSAVLPAAGGAATLARVLPGGAFKQSGPGQYDAVLNVDSLPEIAKSVALDYLRHAREVAGWLFSINQEARAPQTASTVQGVARDLVAEAGGFRPVMRSPNWVRPGYVDELWRAGIL